VFFIYICGVSVVNSDFITLILFSAGGASSSAEGNTATVYRHSQPVPSHC